MIRRAFLYCAITALTVGLLGLSMSWNGWHPSAEPDIVVFLRDLPEVSEVTYSGPATPHWTVIHIRDWHLVPRDLAEQDGHNFEELVRQVELVQEDEMAIIRALKQRRVYSEGLSQDGMAGLDLRIALASDPEVPAEDRNLLTLQIGAPGRLLMNGEIDAVIPLEDQDALTAAGPYPTPEKLDARRRAIVRNVLQRSFGVMVLGGSHDLGPYFPAGTLYVRVTPRSFPAE